MNYAYIRVSTDKQTVENQRFEIERFCAAQNIKIDFLIEETVSGVAKIDKRKLGKLIPKLKKDDILIVTELSRLGRSLFQIMSILNTFMENEVQVWAIKGNYKLGANIQSKVLAFAFSLAAEIERNLISQRTKEALSRLQAEGKILGRKKGSKNKIYKLDGKERQICEMLAQNISKSKIAQKTSVNIKTLNRVIKRLV